MALPEPPPRYIEYPRPQLAQAPSDEFDTDLMASWVVSLCGIPMSPAIGVFSLIFVNRAIKNGARQARFARAIQILILAVSAVGWVTLVMHPDHR